MIESNSFRGRWGLGRVAALAVLLACLCSACATTQPFVAEPETGEREAALLSAARPASDAGSEVVYRVFLIGDAGSATPNEPALRLLKAQLAEAGKDGAVVFLGDNIYPHGLPDSASAERPDAEARLKAQLKAVEDFAGRIVFLPGNHDWDRGGEALARQEAYVEQYLDRGNTFLPDNGFPGPAEVELTDEITLLVLDTEWWLAKEQTFGDTGAYDLEEPADVLLELEGLLYKHRKKNLLVTGHHPLFSNGRHGGRFSLKEHLTPLPLVGSVELLYRRLIGYRQDLVSARYRLMRRELVRLFRRHENLVYAAGHEHNLQHFRKGSRRNAQHYLVSGAGSKTSPVAGGHGAAFTAGTSGFVSLHYYADGSVWIEAWTSGEGVAGRRLYRQRLKDAEADLEEDVLPPSDGERYPDYRDSTVVQAVNPDYAKVRGLGAALLGRRYRDLWATPVEVPVVDLGREAGGLTPLQLGGAGQSNTLQMEAKGGKVYVLRSIDKEAGRALAPELRRTLAGEVLQDQTMMHHPFGALVVPPLADAIGVYHTNPRLVYVPDDPRLGAGREVLAGQVVLFEERPDEDMSDVRSMGYADNVIGSTKLFQEISGDNDHRVDAYIFARARLLDMLVADWDRHPGQWRWAAFEPYELDSTLTGKARKQGKVYRPVPRDRDMAFLQVSGLFPSLYALLADPLRQDFDDTYGYLRGLNKRGLPLDRRFTASLTRRNWIEIADSVRAALTDGAIEAAVRALPDPVFEKNGAEMIQRLKVRRDKLPEVAETYYGVLARVVDIVGSDKHERFEVERLPGGETDVVVYKTSKKGDIDKEIYRRTFYPGETKEVRLYGLGGRDQFILRGDVRRGIRVRAIGGSGEDAFVDSSRVGGRGKKTRFYDAATGENTWKTGPETAVTRSDDPAVNRYELGGYAYNTVAPVAFFGSNQDDGLFIGGGAKFIRHGFRKRPYAATHRIEGNFAAATQAFNLRYQGHYVEVVAGWDLGLEAAIYSPNNIRNFYGLGNETKNTAGDARFYQARLARALVKPLLARSLQPGVTLQIGPTFEYTDVRDDKGRFASQPQAGVSPNTFGQLAFGGAEAALTVEAVDGGANPRQGFRFKSEADVNAGLVQSEDTYATLASSLTLYYSPSLSPQVTLAARAGAAHNIGAFPFFDANTLGGSRNLRGYRGTRFAGRTSAYQNLDVRVELLDFAGYLGYGWLGVLGFIDNGRVWTDGERSDVWHQGYGGGLWAYVFRAATLTGTVGFSEEDRTFTVELGFLF